MRSTADLPGVIESVSLSCLMQGYELFATVVLGVSPPWLTAELLHTPNLTVLMYDLENGEMAMASATAVLQGWMRSLG